MKTMKHFVLVLLGVSMLFTACKDKENNGPTSTVATPEYGVDFAISVTDQEVSFSYTGDARNVQWFYGENREKALEITPLTGKEVKATINIAGTYVAICAVSNGGDYVYSADASFEVTTSDMSYLQKGIWKALSDGKEGYNVVFKLDAAASAAESNAYFHNPLDFWGDRNAGATDAAAWGPWGGSSIFDWGGEPEVGTISFDCVNMKYRLTLTDGVKYGSVTAKDGEPEALNGVFEGTFTLTPVTRDLTETVTGGDGVAADKWGLIFNAKYDDVVDLAANTEWATISFDENGRFPMDKGRVAEGMFNAIDLRNLDIFYADDKGLVISVKRTYDGWEESNPSTKIASSCWLLYNYIIEGQTYDKEDPYADAVAPVLTTITASDIEGTWALASASAPIGWVDWSSSNYNNLFDVFESATSCFESILGWWAFGNPEDATSIAKKDAAIATYATTRVTFNADGSCTILDAMNSYDDATSAYVPETYTTTYTLSNGVITFASEVYLNCGSVTLNGTEMYFLMPNNANGATTDLWIGQDNGNQSKAIHLVPVTVE